MTAAESSWLRHFCSQASFFQQCPKCSAEGTHSVREATANHYCVETQQELCSCCLQGHGGTVIQVRRSSYHDVVRLQDISKLADVSGIQSYTINGARVLFLRRRPQPRPPKGAVGASQCTICSRHLQDVSLFCSLECKLDGLACSSAACGAAPAPPACHPPAAAGHIPAHGHAHAAPHAHHLPSSSHSSDSHTGPETPSHFRALRAVDGSSSDSDSVGEDSYIHCRRKGLPHRSPLD